MKLANSSECTGCSSCSCVCPMGAISMQPDKEGFYRPVVDAAKCVECGLCEKTCPVLTVVSSEIQTSKNERAYYSLQERSIKRRDEGSSGGAFGCLASYILHLGGVVFGASFDDELHLAHTSTDQTPLSEIKKSKYVESNVGNIFVEVKKKLESQRMVLFCGTPCQVAGLRSYLRIDYPNLYAVDFLCHGVPSKFVLDEYLAFRSKEVGVRPRAISFRSKALGWKTYCIELTFEDGKKRLWTKLEDPYLEAFFKNLSLRESCYNCDRALKSCADITLGDFWGVTKFAPKKDDDTGISLVTVNSVRGERLLREALESGDAELTQLPPSAVAYAFSPRKTVQTHRYAFFNQLREQGFQGVKVKDPSPLSRLRSAVYKLRGLLRGRAYQRKLGKRQHSATVE